MEESYFRPQNGWEHRHPGKYKIYARMYEYDPWTVIHDHSIITLPDFVTVDTNGRCYLHYAFVVNQLYGPLSIEKSSTLLSMDQWEIKGVYFQSYEGKEYVAPLEKGNYVSSLYSYEKTKWTWPLMTTSSYTRCWISKNSTNLEPVVKDLTDTDWIVACFVNNPVVYVIDQVDISVIRDIPSITQLNGRNNVHSSYTWDTVLTNEEMKIVTMALRKEIGGIPMAQTTHVAVISDLRAYNLRFLLAIRPPQSINIFADMVDDHLGVNVKDRMGNGYDVKVTEGIARLVTTTGTENKAVNSITSMAGTSNTRLLWPVDSVPEIMTMCSVSRYTGGDRGRIWSCSFSPSQDASFEHGHVHNGLRGSSYFGKMKTDTIQTSSKYTDWLILCASTSTVFPGNVVDDQMQTGTSGINWNKACRLNVNYQSSLDLASNFEVHSLFVWNEELSTAQMLSVTSAMRAQLGGSGFGTPQNWANPIASRVSKPLSSLIINTDEKVTASLETYLTQSGVGPGSGQYRIVSSHLYPVPGERSLAYLFMASGSGYWGNVRGTSSLDGIYEGMYVYITMPQCFKMKTSGFVQPYAAYQGRIPGKYKIYARNTDDDDWTLVFEQLETDTNEQTQVIDISPARCYFQYGLVVSETRSESGQGYLGFEQWDIKGEWEPPHGFSTPNNVVDVDPRAPSAEPYCIVCPIGWWLDLVGNDCIPCPTGTYGTLEGATTASTCLECAAGTYNPDVGKISCMKCPFNTYSEHMGTRIDSCMQCPSDSYTIGIGSTSKHNCSYYLGDGSTSPCDSTQQNEAFFVLLRNKPPLGINIFSKYDDVEESIPEIRGIDYVVNVILSDIESEERPYLYVQSEFETKVRSLYVPKTMTCTWPVLPIATYTRCWVARTNAHANWNVACFTKDPPQLVFDQVDQEFPLSDPTIMVAGFDNWIHSTYTWDEALTRHQMKLVTQALRKEIGGMPFSGTNNIIPIQDTSAYNARLVLTMSSINSFDNQADNVLVDKNAYCATCEPGHILDPETGDCNWCTYGYFIDTNFDICTACPYGLTVDDRYTTDAASCAYYIGNGVTAPCDDHQQNDVFLILLKTKPPIGINIFADYDEDTGTVPDTRGSGYVVEIDKSHSSALTDVITNIDNTGVYEFNSGNSVTSLGFNRYVSLNWPTSTPVYTRCSVARSEYSNKNWTVACFVNNPMEYVNDQVYFSNSHNGGRSMIETNQHNWIHSSYTWETALNIDEMKIVTAALRKEIGGVPFTDSIAVVPIEDLVKYKVRRYLTVSGTTGSASDYCAVCSYGFSLLISGDCVECGRHYFPDGGGGSVPYCTECPPGYFESEDGCFMCPAGSYSDIGDIHSRCATCPEGTQSSVASDDIQDCICMLGHTAESNGVICNPCPENTFKSNLGVGVCETCEVDYSSPGGSTGISDCFCTGGTYNNDV